MMPKKPKKFLPGPGAPVGNFDPNVLTGFPNLSNYNYDNGDKVDGGIKWIIPLISWHYLGVSALKVDKYLALLFRDQNYGGVCELFSRSDPLLEGNPIGNNEASSMIIIKGRK